MTFKQVRYYIFLKDIFLLSVTSFGGPQAHLAMILDMMVRKRAYLREQDLIELYALCQIIPGPTSTQTVTSIGYKIGGAGLAYLTLLVWILPAFLFMTALAILVSFLQEMNFTLEGLRYIQPIAVGIVAYSAYKISSSVISSKTGYFLMILAALASYYMKSPAAFPVLLIAGGMITAFKYQKQQKQDKSPLKINWTNFALWAIVFIGVAVIGAVTKSHPIRIFENFYRSGSLIFGGGQVLVPLLYKEFVEFKQFLSSQEFISGYGFVQAIPGPTFSFSSYVGALILRDWGIGGQILGAIMATAGIFLPGTFFIFFVIRIWDDLKKYRIVKASLEGINAVSSGLVIAATFLLFEPIEGNFINYTLLLGTACLLFFTKIRTPYIILAGLIMGLIIS